MTRINLKYMLPLWIFLLTFCPKQTQGLTPPSLYSQSGIVIEAQTGKVLYQKNPDYSLDPASMTKVMTAYIVFEELRDETLSLDTKITVSEKNATLSTGNIYFPGYVTLQPYAEVSVDQLLQMIFVYSASAPCVILAEHIEGSEEAFVQRMNQTAQRLSMTSTYQNCHGAYDNRLTARDQSRLIQIFIEEFPEIYTYTGQTLLQYNGRYYATYTHFLVKESSYYDPTVTGFKIGGNKTSGTCHSTTVTRDGITLIIVTFNASRNSYCFDDHKNLISYGFNAWHSQTAPYEDMADCPDAQHIYEAFRDLGINLQSINGWVRPTDHITLGEFSTTLVSALETLSLIEKTTPNPAPNIWDIGQYCHYDHIQRGVAYGILPTTPDNSFSPQVTMPREDMQTIFQMVEQVIPKPETEYAEDEIETSQKTETAEMPEELEVPEEPHGTPIFFRTLSTQYITRHTALLEILSFLQSYGVLQELTI